MEQYMEENKTVNTELEELKKNINTLKGKITTLDNKRKELEKDAKELIAKTIYQKKQEIEKSYDEVIKEAEVRLKSVEKEKVEEKKRNLNIIIDHNTKDEAIYHCGGSSKDGGKRITSITKVSDVMLYQNIIDDLQDNPPLLLGSQN